MSCATCVSKYCLGILKKCTTEPVTVTNQSGVLISLDYDRRGGLYKFTIFVFITPHGSRAVVFSWVARQRGESTARKRTKTSGLLAIISAE